MANGAKAMRNCVLVTCVYCISIASHGQDSGGQATPAVAVPAGKPVPTVSFHSDQLDLSLAYPDSLKAQTLPSLKEQHAAIAEARKSAPGGDTKSNECADSALLASRNDSPAMTTKDGAAHAITANIRISRMGVDCMPDGYKQQLDNMATAMSVALSQDRDLHPVDQPIWYLIGTTKIHFAAGENAPPTSGAGGQAAPVNVGRWVGSAVFLWGGNLVSIVMESNDLHFFNEMLHSKLTLGKQPASALFPAEIGRGKPIQPKDDAKDDQ